MAKDDRKARILERAAREKVKFMRLQFTDILKGGMRSTTRKANGSSVARVSTASGGSCVTRKASARYLRIDELPGNLSDALDELEKDSLMRETLGDHIFQHFVEAKRAEWDSYIRHVSPWEIERYLNTY